MIEFELTLPVVCKWIKDFLKRKTIYNFRQRCVNLR